MTSSDYPSLSILIPAYRRDISSLVDDLKDQAAGFLRKWEIIILDDASGEPWTKRYKELAGEEHLFCHTMKENTGRAAARNRLAALARNEALLFMDCDARIIHPRYLQEMLSRYDGKSVVTGKTAYSSEKPSDPSKRLRWKYGTKRESVPASVRRKYPYRSFSTFHFMAPADIFRQVSFRSAHTGYGHEDTIFGLDLRRAGIPVVHTDIPLQHDGIDDAEVFLGKTGEAVYALAEAMREEGCNSSLRNEVRLVRWVCKIRILLKFSFTRNRLKTLTSSLKKHLTGANPSLFFLDLYKFGLLVSFLYSSEIK